MMETYKIYPHGLRKLDQAGIIARIDGLCEEDIRKYKTGAISMEDIRRTVGRMEGEGFLRNLDKSEKNDYKQMLYRAARGENFYWTTTRIEGKLKERAVVEDFYLMSGIRNLAVLQDNEVFDYKKFNFGSLFEFTGTVGAALEIVSKTNGWKYGLSWDTKKEHQKTISSVVTSDGAGELRIFQHDITPYETSDPSGMRVHYRRLGITDKKAVEAASSTESYLLVSILKYVDQLGLKPEVLEKGPVNATQYVTNIQTESRAKQYKHITKNTGSISALFSSWDTPLPVIKDGKIPDGNYAHFIPATLGGGYASCINENGNMVIGRKIKNEINVENAVTFMPEDMNYLIKSLLYQAARGLGKTTERYLLDIIDYRFTKEINERYRVAARS